MVAREVSCCSLYKTSEVICEAMDTVKMISQQTGGHMRGGTWYLHVQPK